MANENAAPEFDYVGEKDVLFIFQIMSKEFEKYVRIVQGKDLSTNDFTNELKKKLEDWTVDDALSETSENPVMNKVIAAELTKKLEDYAKLNSPAFIGSPTVPTAADGNESGIIASTKFVATAISNALASFVGISFDGPYNSYEELVQTVTEPKLGTIYLVKNSGSAPNAQDEYYWKQGVGFELFGTTAVDLSGYVKKTDLGEIPEADIKAAWESVFGPIPS